MAVVDGVLMLRRGKIVQWIHFDFKAHLSHLLKWFVWKGKIEGSKIRSM